MSVRAPTEQRTEQPAHMQMYIRACDVCCGLSHVWRSTRACACVVARIWHSLCSLPMLCTVYAHTLCSGARVTRESVLRGGSGARLNSAEADLR